MTSPLTVAAAGIDVGVGSRVAVAVLATALGMVISGLGVAGGV